RRGHRHLPGPRAAAPVRAGLRIVKRPRWAVTSVRSHLPCHRALPTFGRRIMLSNWFYRWVRGKSVAKCRPSRAVRRRVLLELDQLENRLAPATFTWQGGNGTTGTLWSNPNNWVEHQVPTATDPEKDDVLVFPSTGVVSFISQNDLGNVSTSQIRIAG